MEFVNKDERKVSAGLIRRSLFVTLQVFGAYLADRLIVFGGSKLKKSKRLSEESRIIFEETSSFLRQNLFFVPKFHLALFYLTGTYHSLAKRIFRVKYLTLRPQTSGETLKLFHLLGLFALAESLFSFGLTAQQFRTKLKRRLKQIQRPSVKGISVK